MYQPISAAMESNSHWNNQPKKIACCRVISLMEYKFLNDSLHICKKLVLTREIWHKT